jgi:hypothetical protein
VKSPSPRNLRRYAEKCLGLQSYLHQPGDGRPQPQLAACTLLWAMLILRILRESSFLAVEQMVRSASCQTLGLQQSFGDDALGYFTERLDATRTRVALTDTLQRAKRNQAFQNCRLIGLAIDGTTAGHSAQQGCAHCRPQHNAKKKVIGYSHQMVTISVVGTGLSLPFDAEPYGPGDSEYAAGQRLLRRAMRQVGARFADYLVADGEYATAPFLHVAQQVGIPVVARLKDNLPELTQSVQRRFASQPPTHTYRDGQDRIEIWDADDCAPWEALHWDRVRVMRYRQHKPDGTLVQAEWLTDLASRRVGSLSLYRLCKSRWEIENQAFNDAKNRYGLAHICHHEPNSILVGWLITFLAMMIERLYRTRYLHRGTHPRRSAAELHRLLWLSLSRPPFANTS